jgi:alkanesulfonate monooxygenase SsuD/methylene tetrahydromethanopterin reductase-like flavin-dependent oxidoreductase (luciferase family)
LRKNLFYFFQAADGGLARMPGGPLRFCYAESMTDPSCYPALAQAAEDAGYDSMVIPDSICYPLESDSVYPFNPDGTREFLEDKPFLEAVLADPRAGRGHPHAAVRDVRAQAAGPQPGAGGQAGHLGRQFLTGGQLVLGVGSSPWREDYEVRRRAVGGPRAADGRGHRDHPRPGRRGYFEFHGTASTCRQ